MEQCVFGAIGKESASYILDCCTFFMVVGFPQDELRKVPKDKISWDDFFNDGQS